MTGEMLIVFAILIATVILFIIDRIRVDVVAMLVLLALAWTRVLSPAEAFSGLSSNAVLSMIAVMIMGNGISRTGIMNKLSDKILSHTSTSEGKIRSTIGFSVGLMSAFIQNIGAVALFLPALTGISKKSHISLSRLIMPLGFAAILGGTLTMIASGPLIILNDLMLQSGLERFPLFYVTPLGIILLIAGLIYFNTIGKRFLPGRKKETAGNYQQELIDKWYLPSKIIKCRIGKDSKLIGLNRDEVNIARKFNIYILAISREDEIVYAPWRYTVFEEDMNLALLCADDTYKLFANEFSLEKIDELDRFEQLSKEDSAGFAEIIVPPRSHIDNKTIRDISLRKNYNIEPLMLIQGNTEFKSDFSDTPLKTGSTIIVHGTWQNISNLRNSGDFVILTPFEKKEFRPGRAWAGLICFLGAIILALLGVKLSLALFSGAVAMVLFKVISIDEAYSAIDWKTVFLIAGLIPLGIAMEKTGAAQFIAENIVNIFAGAHTIILLFVIGALTTLFSLFMSNVAAAVLLIPLIISLAPLMGADARILSMFVAICTANSFILPTHQVNAFLLSVGGYKNRDYIKTGGPMTVIFLIIAVFTTYYLYM